MPRAAQFLPEEKDLTDECGVNLEVCQCSSCGLVQLSNDPVPYYRKVIRATAFSEEMKLFRISQFSNFIEEYFLKGAKLLEVGCGGGEYLDLMQQCDASAYGVEFSSKLVSKCQSKGLNVSAKYIEQADCQLEHAPFDAFYSLNFLEHQPNINAILKGISTNLKPGAIGLIEVPNFDSDIENNIFSNFIADHLYYFTADSLKHTLNHNGFDIVSCKTIWKDTIISAIVKKKKRLNLSDFYKCQKRICSEINNFIDSYPPGKVAIWGASHQALTIIAMAELSGKISYVIDSATFKQGNLLPLRIFQLYLQKIQTSITWTL